MTVPEVLSALEAEVTADGEILLEKLRELLDDGHWPERTHEAAVELLGASLHNRKGQRYTALDRRIRHALRVWDDKYGPLNPEQHDYADDVLQSGIRKAVRLAQDRNAPPMAYIHRELGSRINDERVDAGFKRRADSLIDVTAELVEALA